MNLAQALLKVGLSVKNRQEVYDDLGLDTAGAGKVRPIMADEDIVMDADADSALYKDDLFKVPSEITIRDDFAKVVVQALVLDFMRSDAWREDSAKGLEVLAGTCYEVADALCEARER